ncbi:MAG: PKD domain-containing protein [Euryarchaeota archaeon]|nr:PKD domain-containing protein [Euryarchaeota archaeon]
MKNKMGWLILAISIGFAIIVSGIAVGLAEDSNTETANSTEGTHVVIQAFDQNPAGNYSTNIYEWVMLYNPTIESVNISGWTISSIEYRGGKSFRVINISIPPKKYLTFVPGKPWLHDTKGERIILKDAEGNILDETLVAYDEDDDNLFYERHPVGVDTDSDSDWRFGLQTLDKGGLRRGTVKYVYDGDTIHISPVCSKATEFITYNATQHIIPPDNITDEGKIYISPVEMAGIQSVRLDGIDTPELKTKEGDILEEGNKSRNFLDALCGKKEVVFDIDDCSQYGKYDRVLAMVYVNGTNVNQEMLINGSAKSLIITPSEFIPYANYTYTPLKLNPVVNRSIAFNASSSRTFDPNAAIVSYEWSFGDGTNRIGKITNHTYQSPGNYTVCLEVTDSDGKERRCNAVDITLMVYLTNGKPPIAGTPLLRCGC